MSIENNAVVVKNGTADLVLLDVIISAENQSQDCGKSSSGMVVNLQLVKKLLMTQLQSMFRVCGNGHSYRNRFTLDGKDDVIGSYTAWSNLGRIIFTPKKKFESKSTRICNVGNNKYIQFQIQVFLMILLQKGDIIFFKDNITLNMDLSSNMWWIFSDSWRLRTIHLLHTSLLWWASWRWLMVTWTFTANGANAAGQPTVWFFCD